MNPYNVYVNPGMMNPMGQPMAPVGSPISVGPVGPINPMGLPNYTNGYQGMNPGMMPGMMPGVMPGMMPGMPGMMMQPGLQSGGIGYSQGARL